MANSKVNRLKVAVEAKRVEYVELFKIMGKTTTSDGRALDTLHPNELQELYKYGIKK